MRVSHFAGEFGVHRVVGIVLWLVFLLARRFHCQYPQLSLCPLHRHSFGSINGGLMYVNKVIRRIKHRLS
jgi:hypothetical protein